MIISSGTTTKKKAVFCLSVPPVFKEVKSPHLKVRMQRRQFSSRRFSGEGQAVAYPTVFGLNELDAEVLILLIRVGIAGSRRCVPQHAKEQVCSFKPASTAQYGCGEF